MAESPLLFRREAPPTARAIALRVKARGLDGLPDASERADNARYQEIVCRSALNRVKGMPFEWTLNPYRGCTHACHYCYARKYQTQLELDADDEFSSVILVKRNLVEVLTRELARTSWSRELVAVGTATDPYQPVEGHYRLTRRSLEALARSGTPVGLVTKGPMIVRDIDVLQELTRRSGCTVYVSVPSVDEQAWEQLEPGTAHPLQRLRAVREMRHAGIDAGVLMAPIVPGFTSQPEKLERTVEAIADHGAAFVGMNLLFLEGGSRDHFMSFLAREHPQLLEGYQELYSRKYVPQDYARRMRMLVSQLQQRYEVARRTRRAEPPAQADGAARLPPGQRTFEW